MPLPALPLGEGPPDDGDKGAHVDRSVLTLEGFILSCPLLSHGEGAHSHASATRTLQVASLGLYFSLVDIKLKKKKWSSGHLHRWKGSSEGWGAFQWHRLNSNVKCKLTNYVMGR